MVYVAIMGFGTIGSGVAEVLRENREEIKRAAGDEVALKYVLDLREFPGSPIEKMLVHDFSVIEKDPEVRIVVETMGGVEPAYSFVKAALLAGKHVATSNKALVAARGTELLRIARENKVNFFFEASTGGGIPIIRTMTKSLAGEKTEEINGILNGTTNYILTRMDTEGAAFDDVLKDAQRLGYAERNPEADVEGHDTCRKLAILTGLATGREVDYTDIPTEGITGISDVDFKYAAKLGMSIKLLGHAGIGQTVSAWVAPVLVEKTNPLYMVSGVYNGILLKTNMLGTSMYYGSGAGKLPTASAVAADIIEAAANISANLPFGWGEKKQDISCAEKYEYFIRAVDGADLSGFPGLKAIAAEADKEAAFVTGPMSDEDMKAAKNDGIISSLRIFR